MPHCPGCDTELDGEPNYCPNCGEELQGASLPAVQDAETTIRIEFGWSRSKYYQDASELAEKAPTYDVKGDGKDARHTTELTHEKLGLAERLWNLVEGWKSSALFIDGERIESSSIWHGGLECFSDRQDAQNGEKYCWGSKKLSLVGCNQIGLLLSESFGQWRNWGHWDSDGKWHFRKGKIRDHVSEKVRQHRFCPVLKTRDLESLFGQIPDVVDPSHNPRWLYPRGVYTERHPDFKSLTTGPRPVPSKIIDKEDHSWEIELNENYAEAQWELRQQVGEYWDDQDRVTPEEALSGSADSDRSDENPEQHDQIPEGYARSAAMKTVSKLKGHVKRVKDGDTLVVSLEEGRTMDVRLWGVDAPEENQTYGPHATKAARKLAYNEPCIIAVRDQDQYGRLIGRVLVGEKNIDVGNSLVTSGYAWHRTKYVTGHDEMAEQLEEAQESARREGRGLWSQSSPEPPWEYRKRKTGSTDEFGPKDVVRSAKKGYSWMQWFLRLFY